jgi:hydroxymethylbilane synthase
MDSSLDDALLPKLDSSSRHFRIGTRGSDLALWQAHFTKNRLEEAGATVELIIIATQGDRIQNVTFDKMEGKGFFTKEIESSLLKREIDIAVHSHKDLETTSPNGLCIAAVPKRGLVEDVLIMSPSVRDNRNNLSIANGATVGTSSHRRRAQLQALQPDLNVIPLRGNVPTRIQKLRNAQYDGIVIARAGIDRLGIDLSDFHVQVLPVSQFVPAPAQGALAIQMRQNDERLDWVSEHLNDDSTRHTVSLERSVLRALEGGCLLPFGAHIVSNRLRTFLEIPSGPRLSEITIDERQSHAEIAQAALSRLKNPMHGTVFISKDSGKWPVFEALAKAAGLQLITQSLISIEKLSSAWPETPTKHDWLWLTSPSAADTVNAMLDSFPGKIACAGKGTAGALTKGAGGIPSWIGSGTPEESHAEFSLQFNRSGQRIFIPHSDRSIERWASLSDRDQMVSWVAYRTQLEPKALPRFDVAVITSPSQYEAFLQSDGSVAPIVTLGETTASAIKAKDHSTPIEVAAEPSEWEAWLAVERALHL